MINLAKLAFILTMATTLVACGGGSSEEASGATNTTYQIIHPVAVPISHLSVGFATPDANSIYGMATILLPRQSVSTSVEFSSKANFQYIANDHITQVIKNSVWAQGWNGSGTTISIIDDFYTGDISWNRQFTAIREFTDTISEYNPVTSSMDDNIYLATHSVPYEYTLTGSHGSLVSRIAGGNYDGTPTATNLTTHASPATTSPLSCLKNGLTVTTTNCRDHTWGDIIGETITYNRVAGIAKNAVVIENNLNLSSSQTPSTTSAYLAGHLDNSYKSSVINLSLGTDISSSGISLQYIYDGLINSPSFTKKSEAVIVVAAGNSGGPCGSADLAGCNLVAAIMALDPQTRNNVIIVGALAGSGASEKIAIYSTRAGALADRFIMESGDTGDPTVVGTSFAAPRVAAAAAIVRQKFPELTAAEVVNLLLLTASKDIGNHGSPAFSGVSPIFGYGKLDLVKALSPQGTSAIAQ
jgi:subtilisin family serine protease